MAEVIQVQLDIETKKAEKGVDNLTDEIVNLNKEVKKGNEETAKGLKGVEKASDKTAGGVRKIGGALKALGIGLIVAAFAKFTEVLNENQKVADFFSITFETLSLAFNDLFNFIFDNTQGITNFFKAAFDDPIQNMIDFGIAIKNNIIERIQSSIDTLGFLAEAVVKVFKGDFAGALDSAKNAGKELVDVVTGVDDSFDKTVEAVDKVVTATTNYVKETVEAATANINLAKTAELAAVQNQGLIEKYDLQAETLRQVRDEERNTIAERKKANDELNAVLDEQEKAMLANANAILAAAQAQFDKNDNDQNQIALIEAQNELLAVQAQVAGFRSEQKANDLALDREQKELNQSISDAEAERNKAQSEFTAEQIENDYLRLQAQLDIAQQESEIESKRLTEKRDQYQKGTQAYVDANNELLAYQQENANQQVAIEKDLNKSKAELTTQALTDIASIVGKNSKFGKAIAIVQAIRDTYAGATKALSQGGIFGFIGAAAVTAAGIANVKTIASTPDPTPPLGGTSGGGSSVPPTPAAPPAFNVVGQGATSQLADALGNQASEPVRAYVVSNDVTTAQGLERNIVEGATI
tara:strand:+ start:26 stop:1777 length:1752 start_codon:yes stop_codon:yes gene_type:complete